jgi:L-lysine 2,3-aminomutase
VPLQKVAVIRANHASEIDEQVRRACADLIAAAKAANTVINSLDLHERSGE